MPDKAWSASEKAQFERGATGQYKPDYLRNLMEGLGMTPAQADPSKAGSGLVGPNANMAKEALARRLQRMQQGAK